MAPLFLLQENSPESGLIWRQRIKDPLSGVTMEEDFQPRQTHSYVKLSVFDQDQGNCNTQSSKT